MIAFLAPLGLLAFAALALPVLVHLIRRSDERVLDFAALRWLGQHRLPRRQLRLHELGLLLLRLLLLSLLALLLALPVWRDIRSDARPWVVVAAGVDAAAARAAVDSPQAEWHQLAPGFPLLQDAASAAATTSVASLIRELDAELPAATPLTLVVPAELGGLDAARLQLARKVDWRVLPGRSPQPAAAGSASRPLQLAIRYDDAGRRELRVAHALLHAWQTAGLALSVDEASQTVAVPAQTDWLLWLGGPPSDAVRDWIATGGIALLSRQPAASGEVVLSDASNAAVLVTTALGRGQIFALQGALDTDSQAALLAPDFPDRLRERLQTAADLPDRAPAAAVVPQLSPLAAIETSDTHGLRLDRYFALAIALLFLLERLWATRRREAS